MGDRSQVYIRYKNDKLKAYHLKYSGGTDFINDLFYFTDSFVKALKNNEEPVLPFESILDWHYADVIDGKRELTDYSNIWNWSNQLGKIFIDIKPDYSVRYCFTDSNSSYPPGEQKALSIDGYLKWYGTANTIEKDNTKEYALMTDTDLKEFILYPYDMEAMYKGFIENLE